MIKIIEITDTNSDEVKVFSRLTEAQLRSTFEAKAGLFIAESPKVIEVALNNGYEPFSLLCERKHISGDAQNILKTFEKDGYYVPIYTGERNILAGLTGYRLTRGVLCAMKRKPLRAVEDICKNARLTAIIQGVTDTTNIGSIFRAASALGVDAVVLSMDACDPLNRRAVRVSMGTVFTIPWTMTDNPVGELKKLGFKTAALALKDDSISLDDPRLKQNSRLAVVFGTEGDGLPKSVIYDCDYVVKIPMHHGVDSLNVASAAAVTFWELRKI